MSPERAKVTREMELRPIDVPVGTAGASGSANSNVCNPKPIGLLRDFQSVNGSLPSIPEGQEDDMLEKRPRISRVRCPRRRVGVAVRIETSLQFSNCDPIIVVR